MEFIAEHTRIGFELPEIIALILLVAVVIFYIVRTRKMKNEERELIDQIQDLQREDEPEKRRA